MEGERDSRGREGKGKTAGNEKKKKAKDEQIIIGKNVEGNKGELMLKKGIWKKRIEIVG